MQHQSAMTLLELLLALAILAVVLVIAVPGLGTLLLNVRMQNNVNELIHSLHNARQNANATGISAALCGSVDGRQCSATYEWTRGWLLFANTDDDDPPRIDPGETVLASSRLSAQLRLYANRTAFVMRPFGLRNTNGTLVWCDRRGALSARAVIVSFTGKPRSSVTSASGLPLNCPDFP